MPLMSEWMHLHGGYLHQDKVELRANRTGQGRGLFARQEIYRGECIAVIPTHLAITEATADGCADIHSLMASLGMAQFWDAKIALFLLQETWRPPHTSYWSPFLSALPECAGLLLFAPPEVKLAHAAPFPGTLQRLRERERHIDALYLRLFEEAPRGLTVAPPPGCCTGSFTGRGGLFGNDAGGGKWCWSIAEHPSSAKDDPLEPSAATNKGDEPHVAMILATEDDATLPPPGGAHPTANVSARDVSAAPRLLCDDVIDAPGAGGGYHADDRAGMAPSPAAADASVSAPSVAGGATSGTWTTAAGTSLTRANAPVALDGHARVNFDSDGATSPFACHGASPLGPDDGSVAGTDVLPRNGSPPLPSGRDGALGRDGANSGAAGDASTGGGPHAEGGDDGDDEDGAGARGGGKLWQGRLPSLAEWRWAMAMVHTRAFLLRTSAGMGDDREACLIPVADMLNHSAERACCVIQDPFKEAGGNPQVSFTANAIYGSEEGWMLIASRHIARGEELFIDYCCGKVPEDFLVSYGFLPSHPLVEQSWSQ